ncbi:MAG TPA: hypothetical protein VGI88_14650 [Verrucomicrobiae bacterium]
MFALLIAVQFLAGSVLAVDKLQADLIPQGLRTRSESSIPVEARFKWDGTRILEGHLEVELREGNRVLERYRSGDLALTTGEQTFRMFLPPPIDPYSDTQVEAHMKFVTAHEVFDLDYSILTMPTHNERSLAVGWCNPRNSSDSQALGLQQSLQFERFAPLTDDTARNSLLTSLVRLVPEDLPLQPLAYTSFDVMVLTADGFAEAREGQLHALARWVKGGGSVCVFVGGNLRLRHVAFLNEIAESNPENLAFLADSIGNLLPSREKISCLHSGIGRCVIVMGDTSAVSAVDSSVWRRAVAFLWKFRAGQAQAIANTGHWVTATNALEENGNTTPQSYGASPGMTYGSAPSYSVQQTSLGGELMGQLMPRTVRLIPFSALFGTLGLFLVMIGPVDYFILGWLGRRRFTWVLFPVTSILFMLATVAMANYYLGRHNQRRSLIVVDMDKDGTAVRWNRYELIFAARDKQAVNEVKDALWTSLKVAASDDSTSGFDDESAGRNTSPPWYEGAVPVHFRASESLHQWQPKLNRIFSFEPPPAPLLANWSEIEKAWPDLKAIRVKLSEKTPFTGDLCAISSAGGVTFDPGSAHRPGAQSAAQPVEFDYNPTRRQSHHVTLTATNWILAHPILSDSCLGGSEGLQSLVSQVSPNGGANFEDLPAMDTEAGDSTLAIVTQSGDDIIVYRRFFHGN